MPRTVSGAKFFIIMSLIGSSLSPLFFQHSPQITWLSTLILMIIFRLSIGYAINERFTGIFIDYPGNLNLSKLLPLCGSVLILSALSTAAWIRIWANADSPLEITLDKYLLAIMVISLTTLIKPHIHGDSGGTNRLRFSYGSWACGLQLFSWCCKEIKRTVDDIITILQSGRSS